MPSRCYLAWRFFVVVATDDAALDRGGEGVAAVGLVLVAVAALGGVGAGHRRGGAPTAAAAKGGEPEEGHLE